MIDSRLSPLQTRLLAWFDIHARDLPWRRTYAPYQVWISEIMLQQTQMGRAVSFFERWMRHLPDIARVAAADEGVILKLWEGLGYYSRARNIHLAAKMLVEAHGGEIPDDHAVVSALPGVGPYTAGAIMSFAFNRTYPIVDANIERLFARLFDLDTPVKQRQARSFIWNKASELIPEGEARRFNQAVMELGGLVCRPRMPDCPACPIASLCAAHARGTVLFRPVVPERKKPIPLVVVAGILRDEQNGNAVLIRQRPPDALMPSLWEFPGCVVEGSDSPRHALRNAFAAEFGLKVELVEKFSVVRHGFTNHACTLHAYLCRAVSPVIGSAHPTQVSPQARWVALADLAGYAYGAGQRKLVDQLLRDLRVA